MMKVKTALYAALLASVGGLGLGLSDTSTAANPDRLECLSECREARYECVARGNSTLEVCQALFEACRASCG
jgi:hypothetical protein